MLNFNYLIKILSISTIASLLLFAQADAQRLNIDINPNVEPNFYDIQKMVYDEWENSGSEEMRGFKQFKRWEHFWFQRTYPNGIFPEGIDVFESLSAYQRNYKDNLNFLGVKWTSHGPHSEPQAANGQQGMGRVNSVRFNPNNQNEIWAGSASGGLWRSIDYGKTWSTFPFTQFMSLGVSDIGISTSNPNIVYVSTGDIFGSTSNRNFYSIGLIKTTNGGSTWDVTALNHKLEERVLLSRVLVHPQNPNIVFVGSSKGIFKTTDGGNTWDRSESQLHVMDMEFKPGNSDVLYASTYSTGGSTVVFASYDSGLTWARKLIVGNSIRTAIAVTPANPERIYALVANSGSYGFNSLHKSDDSGETWEQMSTSQSLGRNPLGWYTGNLNSDNRGQGFYDLCIAANPKDADEIYIGGINIWRSSDAGANFVKVSHWTPSQTLPYVHADQHDLVFAPDRNTLFVGNDGGINATINRGTTWDTYSNGMNITQYYKIGVSQSQNATAIAGAQDNGTALVKNGSNWSKVYSSDGMECIIDPDDATRMYASIYNGSIFRSLNGGQSFTNILSQNITGESGGWVTPYILNPQNPRTMYAGFLNVWKSESYGARDSWKKISSINPSSTLQALAVAPSDTNVIYAASVNQLFATYDGGEKWSMIHSSNVYITNIAVDYNNPRRVWLSKSGFNESEKVLEIIDSSVVRNLTGNLPNVPVNTIVIQENSPDRLYIGTDIGVFVTDYNSMYWERYGEDLPNVIANELEIHTNEKRLYAGTYGRGLWSVPLIECNAASPEIEVDSYDNFCPGDTITIRAKNNYSNYKWSNGATTKEIKITKPGAYSLFVVDNNGCIGRSEAYILPKSQFDEITITRSEDEFLCPEGELNIYATSGFATYRWSNGNTDGRQLTIKEPGYYSVIGITDDGCVVSSDSVYFDMKPGQEKPTITQDGNKLISSYGNSYQWFHNDKRLFNQTEREHVIQAGRVGDYTVVVSNEFNCTNISDPFNVATSVENNIYNDYDVVVHNNPGNGNYNIEFTNPIQGALSISVTDLNGRELFATQHNYDITRNYILDITHLATSVYLVKITANNFVKTVKVVKN